MERETELSARHQIICRVVHTLIARARTGVPASAGLPWACHETLGKREALARKGSLDG